MSRGDDDLEHIHRVEYSTRERLAGLFVIVAAALLVAAFAFSQQLAFLFADTFTLHAYIEDAGTVEEDAAVELAGLSAGKVSKVEWVPDRQMVRVTMTLRERFHEHIRKDSRIAIGGLPFLGDGGIEITRGTPSAPRLPDGATIPVEDGLAVEDIMSRVMPAIENVTEITEQVNEILAGISPETVTRLTENITRLSGNLSQLVQSADEGDGIVAKLFHDERFAADITATMEQLVAALEETEQRLAELQPLISSTEAATGELPGLIEESTALADELTTTFESLNKDAGAVSGVLIRLRSLLDEAERTMRAIQNTWPISTGAPEEPETEALPPQPPEQ